MKTKTIKLKDHTAEMAAYLTTAVDRGYQKMITKGVSTDGASDIEIKIGIDQMMDAQDYLLEKTLVSLKDKDGTEIENPYETVMNMESKVTAKLYKHIESLLKPSKKAGQKPA